MAIAILDREVLNEKEMQEVQEFLQNDLDEFKKSISDIKDVDELHKMEDDVVARMKEYNETLKTKKYVLADNAVFEDETYTRDNVAKKIVTFLNKNDVKWEYTLGLYQLVKFWKQKDVNEIDYAMYDSTLRLLNQVSFKGYQEWKDILIVNEYMRSNHQNYTKDTSYLIYLSQLQNNIVDRESLLAKGSSSVAGA